jgi:hypothetical protein
MNPFISTRFFGFRKQQDSIQSFVFTADTIKSSSTITHSKDIRPLGTIKAEFYVAKVEEGIFSNEVETSSAASTTTHLIPDSEKFFTHASITTTPGHIVDKTKEPFIPLQKWSNLSKVPMMTMTLHYHTQQTMQLLQQIYVDSHALSQDQTRKRSYKTVAPSDAHIDESLSKKSSATPVDDEVIELPLPPLILPMIDLTSDDSPAEVQYVTIPR